MSKNLMSNAEIIALAKSVDARMEDPPANPPDPANSDPAGGNNNGDPSNSDYPADLGDAGKRAIDRMKAERDESNRKLREAEQKLAAQNPPATGDTTNTTNVKPADGKTPEDVEKGIIERLSQGALRSTVREIAGSKLADPEDALVLGNWTDLTPNEFGEYDRSAITAKIDQLAKDKPYLLKSTKNFQGGADNGQRGDTGNNNIDDGKSQLTREDLKTMSPLDINKARLAGRLSDIMSGKKP